MDVSTLVLKSFSDLWANLHPLDLLLTSGASTPRIEDDKDRGVLLMNNAILMAASPYNPVLLKWQKKMLQYAENPSSTPEEMWKHPDMNLYAKYFQHPTLGILRDMSLYLSFNVMLTQMLNFEFDVQPYLNHVHILPLKAWGFDHMQLSMDPASGTTQPDKQLAQWDELTLLRRVYLMTRAQFNEDEKFSSFLWRNVAVMKISTNGSPWLWRSAEFHLRQQSVLGKLYRAALDDRVQASPASLANTHNLGASTNSAETDIHINRLNNHEKQAKQCSA